MGFLVPVLLGYFNADYAANHETPVAQWVSDLKEAGFSTVTSRRLLEYANVLLEDVYGFPLFSYCHCRLYGYANVLLEDLFLFLHGPDREPI